MNVEPAMLADLPAIRRLLETEGLPANDLAEPLLKHFLVLREGSAVTAVVGLEVYGDVALLRSLVVAEQMRGKGCGAKLTAAAESLAKKHGVAAIYLLTTSADAFFTAHNYRRIDRTEAPEPIRATTQFSALCPASAILMVKP